jgi:regulator of protease activity HflC (stomatin/prohibitin superfamily)
MPTYRNSQQVAEALLARLKNWFLAAFWVIIVLLLISTSYFTVPADSVAVVQRFGQYIGTDELQDSIRN